MHVYHKRQRKSSLRRPIDLRISLGGKPLGRSNMSSVVA